MSISRVENPNQEDSSTRSVKLIEGEDYYIEDDGLIVFTEEYHLKRGFCCKSGCRHCPYPKVEE